MRLRVFLIILSTLLSFGVLSRLSVVQARKDFSQTLAVSYTVLADGMTNVQYEVKIKNLSSTVYAQQFALTLQGGEVQNVMVREADGTLLPVTTQAANGQTHVSVIFPEKSKILGRDRERIFTIGFVSPDIAQRYGSVLEVSVPKLADPEEFDAYSVSVLVPQAFGQPTLVEPTQYTLDSVGDQYFVRFTNAGKDTGISLLFGEQQSYRLSATYHLENTSQNTGIVQVALIPDTAWQTVTYEQIQPSPTRIFADGDGNWIGEFRVAGQAQAEILARAVVSVRARPRPDWQGKQMGTPFAVSKGRVGNATTYENELYTKGTRYWQTNDESVRAFARDHRTPQEIFQFVVSTLEYNYQRFEQADGRARLGASGALQDPKNAVCSEYTDLFVTLARAAGIPARRVTGYALTENSRLRPLSLISDVLHAWPEYYDANKGLWVPVDPTWTDTTGGVDYFSKLDLRHIAFAIQGQSDELPLPAGLYKVPGQESEKDIQVEAITEAPSASASGELVVEWLPSLIPHFGLPTTVQVTVRNTGGAARYHIPVAIGILGDATLLSAQKQEIPALLPWSQETLTLQFTGAQWWKAEPVQVRLFVDNQERTYEVWVRRALPFPPILTLAVGGVVAFLSGTAGGVLVFRHRRKRAVRR